MEWRYLSAKFSFDIDDNFEWTVKFSNCLSHLPQLVFVVSYFNNIFFNRYKKNNNIFPFLKKGDP